MAGTTVRGRLTWQLCPVVDIVDETHNAKSIVLDAPGWAGHKAGQHVDVRLTAEDGYQAQRSYSIASAPEDEHLVITVERLDDGEVSPYLTDELRTGDSLELRGPVGGYFVWDESLGGPVLLIGGGSGVVPLRAIRRHHRAIAGGTELCLLYSARSLSDVIYREELIGADDVHIFLTREWPDDWKGRRGRINVELLADVVWPPERAPLVYVCGPTGFVETAAAALVDLGYAPGRIRTERFGPTGT